MESRISRSMLRILSVLSLVSCFGLGILAQGNVDINSDSPTPVLLSEGKTARAIAQPSEEMGKVPFSKIEPQAFDLNSKIVLYVGDLQLMNGEGANSLRVYAEDRLGHKYRFPVLDIQPASNLKNAHAITVLLTDDIGFWEPPTADGDLVIYVSWRGLASNTARLGLGKMGGDVPTIEGLNEPRASRGKDLTNSKLDQPALELLRRDGDRLRFLEQATFGATRAVDSLPAGMPLRTWINQQFATPYPTFPYPAQPLQPGTPPANCDGNDATAGNTPDVPLTCFYDTYTMTPIQSWNSKEALYGAAQLKHRVAWALSQIWVTSGVDIQQSRHIVEYHKVLSANAFGNFRDIMGPTIANPSNPGLTLNPTMGDYLSMSQSTKGNPNENYAREIMQLFTVGLYMLNPDGTKQCVEHIYPIPCQAGDTLIPTYDQTVVNNMTKVFTGWTFCPPGNAACTIPQTTGTVDFLNPMIMTATANHDTSLKTLLTYPNSVSTIAACGNCTTLANTQAYARNTIIQALDNIFNHPNVGPYISKTLIQQMVTSDPTPAYVGRVAAAFNNNGAGVRGDMKAVITAILLDPEARGSVKTDPAYGKLREPFLYAANMLRAFNVRDAAGIGQSDGVLTFRSEYTGMGQTPFRSPTVFNYYPPDFVIPNTATLGPEFALMTTGTAIQRTNFVNRMVFTAPAIPVSSAINTWTPSGTSLDFSDLQTMFAADTTGGTMVDELNRRVLHGTMSATMRASIIGSLAPIANSDSMGKVRQAVYLVATSSQYQVQR